MTQCNFKGCTRVATHIPMLCVPATSWPIDMHTPLKMCVMCPCCYEHCLAFPPTQLQTEAVRDVFRAIAAGRQPPDFDRGYVQPLRMDSVEYKNMERMQRDRRQVGPEDAGPRTTH